MTENLFHVNSPILQMPKDNHCVDAARGAQVGNAQVIAMNVDIPFTSQSSSSKEEAAKEYST
jgi:hypothetical protein